MRAYVCVAACLCVCACARVCVCVSACVHACVYVCLFVCKCVCQISREYVLAFIVSCLYVSILYKLASFSHAGVLVAIVIGIALVIGVLILTIGVVCLKRYVLTMFPEKGPFRTRNRTLEINGHTIYTNSVDNVVDHTLQIKSTSLQLFIPFAKLQLRSGIAGNKSRRYPVRPQELSFLNGPHNVQWDHKRDAIANGVTDTRNTVPCYTYLSKLQYDQIRYGSAKSRWRWLPAALAFVLIAV